MESEVSERCHWFSQQPVCASPRRFWKRWFDGILRRVGAALQVVLRLWDGKLRLEPNELWGLFVPAPEVEASVPVSKLERTCWSECSFNVHRAGDVGRHPRRRHPAFQVRNLPVN